MSATRPLSPGLPSHGLTMIEFSGCSAAPESAKHELYIVSQDQRTVMLRMRVQCDDLAQITVEEAEILDDLAVDKASAFAEQSVHNVEAVGVELLHDGPSMEERLAGEDDNLVKVREVRDKVVHAWSFRGAPPVLALNERAFERLVVMVTSGKRTRTSHVLPTSRSSMLRRRV